MSGALTDAQLLTRARAGETEAYVDLFARHHQDAVAAAGEYAGPDAADDVVAEAFVRILACLDEGGGPRQTFDAYLDVTLHHAAVQHLRRDLGPAVSAAVPEIAVLEPADPRAARTPALQTFALLTPNAQMALWLREVEEVPPTEVGELLGVDAIVAEQLAHRAALAFGEQHPGPIADLLLPLVAPEPVPASAGLTLVPTPAPAPAVPAASRRSRWLPAMAVAASVALVGALAVSLLGRGPVDATSQQEAAVAPPTLSPTAPFAPGFNGGRMAPAVLGGLVDGRGVSDTEVVDEFVDEQVRDESSDRPVVPATEKAAPEEVAPKTDASAPKPTTTPPPPASTDRQPDDSDAPPTETLAPPTKVVAGQPATNEAGGHTVAFDLTNAVAGTAVTFTVTGDGATIASVAGAGSCEVAGSTARCVLPSSGAVHLTVSVSAPAGGTVAVTVPRGDGSSASASATLPVQSGGPNDELTPTTPAGTPSSPDEATGGVTSASG